MADAWLQFEPGRIKVLRRGQLLLRHVANVFRPLSRSACSRHAIAFSPRDLGVIAPRAMPFQEA